MNLEKIKEEIWRTVKGMNRAWASQQPSEAKLREYFHKEMVAFVPTAPERVEGGDACVAGWMGFANSTKITKWEERDPLISLFLNNTAAVVSYYFDIDYEMNGKKVSISGRDLFTFILENGKWKAVSDQYSPMP